MFAVSLNAESLTPFNMRNYQIIIDGFGEANATSFNKVLQMALRIKKIAGDLSVVIEEQVDLGTLENKK